MHLGTLGTGNHFIEVCLDEADRVWFMLHSGSRGVGNRIGTLLHRAARKQDMRRAGVATCPTRTSRTCRRAAQHFDDYVEAVGWAQDFALREPRADDGRASCAALAPTASARRSASTTQAVNCHHNYVAREHHFGTDVLRDAQGRGARAARASSASSRAAWARARFIVRGKGNPESFESCSHGAGRAMSRSEAKRRFTVADHAAATAGVECRKDADVIDETPGGLQGPIDAVMAAQADLVEVVHTLRQVVCVKG